MGVTNVSKVIFCVSLFVFNVTPGQCGLNLGFGNLIHGVGDAALGAVNGVGNVAHGVLQGAGNFVGNTLKSIGGVFGGHKNVGDQTTISPVPIEITPPPVPSKTVPPVSAKTLPPVISETVSPFSVETSPPVSSKTVSPFSVETSPPVATQTTPEDTNTIIIDGEVIHIIPFVFPTTTAGP